MELISKMYKTADTIVDKMDTLIKKEDSDDSREDIMELNDLAMVLKTTTEAITLLESISMARA